MAGKERSEKKDEKQLFTDPDFVGKSALGEGLPEMIDKIHERSVQVQWKRASSLCKKPELFGQIEAGNIKQGSLGDCWLLAAIAAVANFPGHIRNLFENDELAADGKYTIRLYDIKKGWEDVVIDDLLPCVDGVGAVFANFSDDHPCLWPALLEKAFAKFRGGSYMSLWGGSPNWAWQVMTGRLEQIWCFWKVIKARKSKRSRDDADEEEEEAEDDANEAGENENEAGGDDEEEAGDDEDEVGDPGKAPGGRWTELSMSDFLEPLEDGEAYKKWRAGHAGDLMYKKGLDQSLSSEQLFDVLAAYSQAGYLLGASMKKQEGQDALGIEPRPKREDGLVDHHMYSIIQLVSPSADIKLIQLRNPWGSGAEWNGAWGDESPEWKKHPELAADLKLKAAEDGTFFMPWESFASLFMGGIYMCPVSLPCPRAGKSKSAEIKDEASCPRCSHPYARRWLLYADGVWRRIGEGEPCFVCLRGTGWAAAGTVLQPVAGVHSRPPHHYPPPPAIRELRECEFDCKCYRRNPEHFRTRFHSSFLPPPPACTCGCGRTAAAGSTTCCSRCVETVPDIEVEAPDTDPNEVLELRGAYKPIQGKLVNGAPVWKQVETVYEGECGVLWKYATSWRMSMYEDDIGSDGGYMRSVGPMLAPWLITDWDNEGGDPCKMKMRMKPLEVKHDEICDRRVKRESELVVRAEAFAASLELTKSK